MISARIKEVRRELHEVLAEQRSLLGMATADPLGPRSLSYEEAMVFDELDIRAKRLARDMALLEEQLELEAATAKPPRSNADE